MKNTLADLNNHLFAQLERLGDEDLVGEKLTEEINRAKSITELSSQIISNGKLVLDSIKTQNEYLGSKGALPGIFTDKNLSLTGSQDEKTMPGRIKSEYVRD